MAAQAEKGFNEQFRISIWSITEKFILDAHVLGEIFNTFECLALASQAPALHVNWLVRAAENSRSWVVGA